MLVSRGEIDAITGAYETDPRSMIPRNLADERAAGRAKHLQSLVEKSVYERVSRSSCATKPITPRWVDREDHTPMKCRLTARGFEQKNLKEGSFYSGTPGMGILKLLLLISLYRCWTVAIGDAEQAFLQSPLEEAEPVYLEPPPEAHEPRDIVWLLLKAVPGLKGSPQAWGNFATNILVEAHGLVQSKMEECLYFTPQLVMMRHMDDFVAVGEDTVVRNLFSDMTKSLLVLA